MPSSRPIVPPQLRHLWNSWRTIETQAAWFILLNFLDAAVTWILLTRGNQRGDSNLVFGEANRVAGYFLNHWGFRGLLGFKLGLVLFVCLIGLTIALKHEERARNVLNFGTVVVTGVVLYSVWLYVR